MKTMTVAIPSYQRRDLIVELVSTLDGEARRSPAAFEGLDIVVVLDGSDDGSLEALQTLETVVPLKVEWTPNRGRAACRNTCLDLAGGEIIYFCDDDLIPAAGTIPRHREFHESGPVRMLLGPQVIPEDLDVPRAVRDWWDDLYRGLSAKGRVTRFDEFSIANASAPAHVFQTVGGFDEEFVGYGLEDDEIGLRILASGVEELFDNSLVAWHYTKTDEELVRLRSREIGRNLVRLVWMHPDLWNSYFPGTYTGPTMWVLDHLPLQSARGWMAVSKATEVVSRIGVPFTGRRLRRVWGMALTTANAAGVADLDPGLLPRVFGRPHHRSPLAGHDDRQDNERIPE